MCLLFPYGTASEEELNRSEEEAASVTSRKVLVLLWAQLAGRELTLYNSCSWWECWNRALVPVSLSPCPPQVADVRTQVQFNLHYKAIVIVLIK